MSRLIRPLLAFALLAFVSIARADSLRLLAPANGATLRGGSFAELRWSAAQLPARAEEWEAFLSIDGGKYYAFRVTPHLDIALQRFTFIVPNVDTHDARILIRTGNEAQETHFEIPGAFSIVRDPNAEQVIPRLLQFGRGEAARDGDPSVLSWADGARNGSGITQQSSTAATSHSIGGVITVTNDAPPVVTPSGDSTGTPSIAIWRSAQHEKRASKIEPRPASVNLLLVCSRRNV